MTQLPSKNPGDSRMPELDGIRGLAILLVLYCHYVPISLITGRSRLGDFLIAYDMGWTGVDLFFVLSGFLIGGILMDNRNAEGYFKVFYVRRCCRILPPYVLTLAGFYLAVKCLSPVHTSQYWFTELKGGVPPFWTNLTFTQNFYFLNVGRSNGDWLGVTWSLVVEEQFYLFLPLVIWLLRPSWLLPLLISLICLDSLLQVYVRIFNPRFDDIMNFILPIRGDALLIGVICACIFRRPRWKDWLAQNRWLLYAIFFLLLPGMAYVAAMYYAPGFMLERLLFYAHLIALFYASLLLLVVTHQKGIFSAMMRWTPLRKLGLISYSVYLFHQPINGLLHGLLLGRDHRYRGFLDIAITMLALVVTLIFSSLLWKFMEKPIITWGHSFRYGKLQNKGAAPEPKVSSQLAS